MMVKCRAIKITISERETLAPTQPKRRREEGGVASEITREPARHSIPTAGGQPLRIVGALEESFSR